MIKITDKLILKTSWCLNFIMSQFPISCVENKHQNMLFEKANNNAFKNKLK